MGLNIDIPEAWEIEEERIDKTREGVPLSDSPSVLEHEPLRNEPNVEELKETVIVIPI